MHNVIRKIHLYAGLIILLFVLMYFVSGFLITRGRDFLGPPAPLVTERTEPLHYTGPRTPEALAEYVARTYGQHGRLDSPPQPSGEVVRFSIRRPGTTVDVEVPGAGDTIQLKTTQGGLRGVLNGLHRIHGYRSGSWLFNLFVSFNDLASVSMILFALSGVYLWWNMTKNHLWGWLCLGASCTYAIVMVLYLAFAR